MTDDTELNKRVLVLEQRLDSMFEHTEDLEKRIVDLERENNELRRQLAEVQSQVNPNPASKEYDELTRDEKVHKVRRQLVEYAQSDHSGKSSMKYREIKALFDGYPSPGHCYDLMKHASRLDGFTYDENGEGNKRIRVDLEAVKDERCFHGANKAVDA